MLQILLLLAFLIAVILFFITQQNILSAILPNNRLMEPGQIWLQLIPFFGQVWQFIVVSRISGSISRELTSPKDDSILGISNVELEGFEDRPTYTMGITQCVLFLLNNILTVVALFTAQRFPIATLLLTLSGITCWIIYWVSLRKYLKIIQREGFLRQQLAH